jgi:nucleotide-binding universal stress UspA family protein
LIRILVALATTRHADAIGRQAVEEAAKIGAEIDLLLVTEKEEIDRVYQLKSDPFLLGTRPLDAVLGEIEEEHRRMLAEQAEEIERFAADASVKVQRLKATGSYEREIARVAAQGDYRVIYWLRQNRGFIARFFLGADQDEVVRVEPTPGRTPTR